MQDSWQWSSIHTRCSSHCPASAHARQHAVGYLNTYRFSWYGDIADMPTHSSVVAPIVAGLGLYLNRFSTKNERALCFLFSGSCVCESHRSVSIREPVANLGRAVVACAVCTFRVATPEAGGIKLCNITHTTRKSHRLDIPSAQGRRRRAQLPPSAARSSSPARGVCAPGLSHPGLSHPAVLACSGAWHPSCEVLRKTMLKSL